MKPAKVGEGDINGVDCIKFLMAFAVVMIHISAIAHQSYAVPIDWFIHLAVPYFFVASAYFLGRKLSAVQGVAEREQHLLKHRYRQIFRMFFIWLAIYLPVTLWVDIHNSLPVTRDIFNYVRNVVMFGESAYAWPLWFLWSMGIVIYIYSKAIKYDKSGVIQFCMYGCLVLFGWCIADKTENNMLLRTVNVLIQRPFGGGMYIMSGLLISDYLRHRPIRATPGFVAIAASIILYVFSLPFWELFGGVGLFVLSCSLKLPESGIYKVLRSQSQWIYYTHMYVLLLVSTVLSQLYAEIGLWQLMLPTLWAAWGMAVLLDRLSRHKRCEWLQHLVR